LKKKEGEEVLIENFRSPGKVLEVFQTTQTVLEKGRKKRREAWNALRKRGGVILHYTKISA